MTAQEWLDCLDRNAMLRVLQRNGSDRQQRLFACALCRRIWHLIEEGPCRQAVAASEQYADKQIGDGELAAAQKATQPVVREQQPGRTQANLAASRVARKTGLKEAVTLAVLAAEVDIGEGQPQTAPVLQALKANHCDLIRCIVGNPFHPAPAADPSWLTWNKGALVKLAQAIYDERRFEDLPRLADALEQAGGHDSEMLNHCRQKGNHVRGCWVVDLILGKK